MNQKSSNHDLYLEMREQGYEDNEIRSALQPMLEEGGFSDQEINIYFKGYDPVSMLDAIKYGFQGSVTGLAVRGKIPDALTEKQIVNAGWMDRLAIGAGQMAGDMPTIVGGGMLGLLGGPSAPVTVPAAAFAITEANRAMFMEQIKNGEVQNGEQFARRMGMIFTEAGKGAVIGGATGGMGKLAGMGAKAAGMGAIGAEAGTIAAEVVTMPTVSAGLEGRLPHAQEFVDAALFITALRGGMGAVRNAPDIVPKLRDIYAKTGKDPIAVAQVAQNDPTVRQDIMAVNRDVPEAFATDILDRLKVGQDVPEVEIYAYRDAPWAQAALNERSEPGVIKEKLAAMHESALNNRNHAERLAWGFVNGDEATKISTQTGENISAGYTHTVSVGEIRHALNSHGKPGEVLRGQIPITAEDISRIPEIVRGEGSRIYKGEETGTGLQGIVYEKTFSDGSTVYVEEIRKGKKQLAFKSLWKTSRPSEDGQNAPDLYVQGGAGMNRVVDAKSRLNNASDQVNHDILQSIGGQTDIPVDLNKPVLPDAVLRHEDVMPLSSVVDDIARAIDVPIRTGKMGPAGRKADGIYNITPKVIRTRTANDVATIVHEAGHHIQNELFGDISTAPLMAFRDELAPIAAKPRSGQSYLPEGFAEFVAKYVVAPKEALESAPRFYEHFEKLLVDRAPGFGKALLNAREAVKRWADQPAAQEVLSHISIEGRENEGFISRLTSKDTWDAVYTNLVDRLYPLKKATEILAQGKELPADMNPYTLARTFSGAKGKATHFIERSPFTYDEWKNVGKPLAETLRAVENLDEFRAYLVSRRGLELEGRGIKSGVRPDAMKATLDAFSEKYEPLARELDTYQDHLASYLVDSGMLGREAAAAMREMNQSYVPFFRVMESDGGFWGGGKSLAARNPIRRIKGSGRDIVDPLESIIKNTYAMIEAAEKNAIARALTDLADKADGSGWMVEKLPTPKSVVKVSREEANRAFLASLGDMDKGMRANIKALLKSGDAGEMVTFWQNAAMLDKRSQIAVFRDGKRDIYQVAPEIAEVMNGLNAENVNWFVKLASIPAKMLRAGATLTPDFMVRNLIRDAVSAGVVSRTGFVPGLDTARGLQRAVTKDGMYWDWVKAGGDQASLVSMDRTTLQTTLKDITDTGYPERVWNVVKNPLEMLRLGSELSEKMTRLGEFGKAVDKHGADKAGLMQAAYESRDLMDFSRRGRLTNTWNIVTAFFNASIQGLDRTVRGAVENPRRFVVRAALFIGIPSILNAINNYGDKDVAEVPRAQRDMFWIVPVGEGKYKTLLRIPKPFEQGIIFGSTLERATELMLDAYTNKYGNLKTARMEAFRGLGVTLFDVSAPNFVPTAFSPVVEAFANRSLPFDRPIIPKNREGLLPEYQYAPNTTELTKALSSFVGALPPVGEMNTFSPARAENYIRSWTGGMGMYALQLVDAMARKSGVVDDPVKPAAMLADIPFVRAFVIRHPSMGAESIQRFFDHYEESASYLKSINALRKDFKYGDVANLLPYSVYQAMDAPHKALSKITKAIDLINKIPNMTSDEKRQQIDSLYFRAIDVAKLGNQVFEKLQPDIERLKRRAESQ